MKHSIITLIFAVLTFLALYSWPEGPHDEKVAQNDRVYMDFRGPSDLDILIELMKDRDIVLLGEATHGTEEFYEIRAEISKRLISGGEFGFIVVEGDWDSIYELNLYVRGLSNDSSAEQVLKRFDRWPMWMWANRQISDLADWLKEYNSGLPQDERIGFYGMDVYAAERSLRVVEDNSGLRYDCMSQFSDDFGHYPHYLYQRNIPCHDEAKRIYEMIAKNATLADKLGVKKHFYITQNAYVVKNAEKHYRAMAFADMSSWNERVFHMHETLNRLRDKKGGKAIVWAHNTHVGDARYSAMRKTGNVNMGQLMREAGEDVFILGFGTYTGEVLAARGWGEDMRIMQIPKANRKSYEYMFYEAKMNRSIMIFSEMEKIPVSKNRAIGVVYNPENEYPGNYVETDIMKRYDAFIFLLETQALNVLE